MKHLGDITKIHNADPVWIVTGGSPCQDLSVAGKRAGLKHSDKGDDETTRSGLFMEQIRVTKEMRENDRRNGRTDEFIRPRFFVWENVPGALSSGSPSGEDFRIVLEEVARIAQPDADVPRPAEPWTNAGCIVGSGWSIAWRISDNQFWGTPQRRKRIALVADFAGESAPEILFERSCMQGNPSKIDGQGEETPGNSADGLKKPGKTIAYRKQGHPQNQEEGQGWEEARVSDTLNVFDNSENRTPILVIENHPMDSRVRISDDNVFQTLHSRMGTGGGNVPMVVENMIVRRLTPLECERLQGFPDYWTYIGDWTDSKGKTHKDSDAVKYRAIGNSIGLPFWEWMAKRMVGILTKSGVSDPTLGSLFDGIGGFPLAFSRAGCKPIWASEIEEFPIAVTRYHFPEGENE